MESTDQPEKYHPALYSIINAVRLRTIDEPTAVMQITTLFTGQLVIPHQSTLSAVQNNGLDKAREKLHIDNK